MSDDSIITIRGLRNSFGEQVIHDNLDLDVKRGEILGVVGGSGTGKSVMIKSNGSFSSAERNASSPAAPLSLPVTRCPS